MVTCPSGSVASRATLELLVTRIATLMSFQDEVVSESVNESLDETIALPRSQATPQDLDKTIDRGIAPTPSGFGDSSGSSRPTQQMQLLEGSRPKLSDELDLETLSRLRLVSMLLFGANLAFLIYRLFFDTSRNVEVPLAQATFVAHVAMTIVTGLVAFRTSLGRAMKKYDDGNASKAASGFVSCIKEHGAEECKFISKMRLTGWHLRISEIAVL